MENYLIRWHSNGERDFSFISLIGTSRTGPVVQAVALLPDGALLVSTLEGLKSPTWAAENSVSRSQLSPDELTRSGVGPV